MFLDSGDGEVLTHRQQHLRSITEQQQSSVLLQAPALVYRYAFGFFVVTARTFMAMTLLDSRFMPEFKVCPLLSMLPPARILQRLLENFSHFFVEVRCLILHLEKFLRTSARQHLDDHLDEVYVPSTAVVMYWSMPDAV